MRERKKRIVKVPKKRKPVNKIDENCQFPKNLNHLPRRRTGERIFLGENYDGSRVSLEPFVEVEPGIEVHPEYVKRFTERRRKDFGK